jgi:hypothetical protein
MVKFKEKAPTERDRAERAGLWLVRTANSDGQWSEWTMTDIEVAPHDYRQVQPMTPAQVCLFANSHRIAGDELRNRAEKAEADIAAVRANTFREFDAIRAGINDWKACVECYKTERGEALDRARKAEAERDAAIRQVGQTAAECGKAEGAIAAKLRKAEHDLAEAVEGLRPFAEWKGRKIRMTRDPFNQEFYEFARAGHFRHAASIVAKHEKK